MMFHKMKIRRFVDSDIEILADVISRSLLEINSRDYTHEAILDKLEEYTASNIRVLSRQKRIFVAEDNGQPVGVAMLKGDEISGVFVVPSMARRGIGRNLMAAVEEEAKKSGCVTVQLSSSLTAHTFYEAVGYRDVKAEGSGILMEKHLN